MGFGGGAEKTGVWGIVNLAVGGFVVGWSVGRKCLMAKRWLL